NPQLVPGQLSALAAAVGLVTEQGQAAAALPALRAHLQRNDRWLLVFDNAESPDGLSSWLPPAVGHVLITSRVSGWDEFAEPVQLDLFIRRESVTLLQRRVSALSDKVADLVAADSGHLPRPVAQA